MGNLRTKMVAGNWKMNLIPSEAIQFIDEFTRFLPTAHPYEVVLFPSFVNIPFVFGNLLKRRDISVGAQNLSEKESGAFTGEVSAAMLTDAGCKYVLIGHSERRHIYNEPEELLAAKLELALKKQLDVVYCIGETLPEREAGNTFSVLETQLNNLYRIEEELRERLTVAYEPVWAIGTGVNATPAQAQEAHAYIRKSMRTMWGGDEAGHIRILYGGSVTPSNASQLFACPDVDGGLVGGASLKAESFYAICQAIV